MSEVPTLWFPLPYFPDAACSGRGFVLALRSAISVTRGVVLPWPPVRILMCASHLPRSFHSEFFFLQTSVCPVWKCVHPACALGRTAWCVTKAEAEGYFGYIKLCTGQTSLASRED